MQNYEVPVERETFFAGFFIKLIRSAEVPVLCRHFPVSAGDAVRISLMGPGLPGPIAGITNSIPSGLYL